jgi:hypothetical protein
MENQDQRADEAALSRPEQARLQQAQEALAQAQQRALGFVRQNPIPCLVGGLVAGYLLGRLARSRWLNTNRR